MKILILSLSLVLVSACGRSHRGSGNGLDTTVTNINADIVEEFSYPSAGQLVYQGQLLADLSSNSAVVTPFGSVQRGTVLNVLNIQNKELIVYGEDGVFATECETHPDYPDHGPSHPLCEVYGAENFNRIITCFSTEASTPVLTAQNWPGVIPAMTDSSLGMECWVEGVKMKSNKVFTY